MEEKLITHHFDYGCLYYIVSLSESAQICFTMPGNKLMTDTMEGAHLLQHHFTFLMNTLRNKNLIVRLHFSLPGILFASQVK